MTQIYGHRGARGEAPENTLASFQQCLGHGVKRCELDLHLSLDGQLMVIHDPTLRRTTGRGGKVAEHLAAELKRIDARQGGPGWSTPCPIPTLRELFEQCPFEHWQLEVKSASKVRAARTVLAIWELVEAFNIQNKVTITSSSRVVLRALIKYAPSLQRGFVAEYNWLEPVTVAKRYDCHLLVLNHNLCSDQRIQKAHQAGLLVSAWTVNEVGLMKKLIQQGVDSLITDYPGRAQKVLHETLQAP